MSKKVIALEQVLCRPRDSSAAVAYCAATGLVNYGQWLTRVQQWREALVNDAADKWAVYQPDTVEFTAILMALWSLKKTAVLPANNQLEICQQLQSLVDGFAGDFADSFNPLKAAKSGLPKSQELLPVLDSDYIALKLFTSGSGGKPTLIEKTLSQLSRELVTIHQLWQSDLTNVTVCATVSHQHIYGLLFKVLWPLTAGYIFLRKHCNFFAEFLHELPTHSRVIIVTSPSHLSRLPPDIGKQLQPLAIDKIFSSGAKLDQMVGIYASEELAANLYEVYGSTETGGIAWRQCDNSHRLWQPFEGIVIQQNPANDCLRIRSPYLPNPEQWFNTADRITSIGDNSFNLLGREDDIVKVEGKRVSKIAMAEDLQTITDIEWANVQLLTARRSELGAVIQLSDEGIRQLQEDRKQLINRIKNNLLDKYELTVLPRRFRFLSLCPCNSQGKINQEMMNSLFTQADSLLPLILSTTTQNNGWLLQLWVSQGIMYFDGHFANAPVLPGVVMVHWIRQLANQQLPDNWQFVGLQKLKFQQVVQPDQELLLQIHIATEKKQLNFSYYSLFGQHSSGVINYRDAQ